ncbi:protein YibB [Campylobacter lari]|nr:protein YibB [Campylobacter lari]
MDENLTIVTAFYNIGREKLQNCKRTNEEYLSYFDFWAGIKNRVIIYTTEDLKQKILDIRQKHGLEEKTMIITKNFDEFDQDALNKIRNTFSKYNQSLHRKYPNNIECKSPEYCYLMYLKPFFVCDAIEKKLTNKDILWLDFGFNHKDDFFTNKNQFNFYLKKQELIDEKKMNFFSIATNHNDSLAHIYFSMEVSIIGSILFGNQHSWIRFKEHFRESLNNFISFNIIDDDQPMLIWCYRNYPEYYNSIKTNEWFGSLYNFIPKNIQKTLSFKRNKSKYYKSIKEEILLSKNQVFSKKIKLYFKYIYFKYIYKKNIEI